MRGRPPIDDAGLYEPDTIETGIIIFTGRVCPACERELPANTDYFAPDRSRPDGLVSTCRRCRRAAVRERMRRFREARATERGTP
jgi:hypothetical protein